MVEALSRSGGGKPFRCQPMAVVEADEATGAASSDGAWQEVWLVCAPNQVPPEPAHTTQQVPLADRATRVTLPLVGEIAMLTTDELDDGPAT